MESRGDSGNADILAEPDPVAAVLDTWAFIFQMTAYMERPASKQRMGKSYPVVVETLRNMDAEMERLILMAAPTANVADLRQRVGAWAEAHPIQASLTGRQSVDPDVIQKVGQSDLGIKPRSKRWRKVWATLRAAWILTTCTSQSRRAGRLNSCLRISRMTRRSAALCRTSRCFQTAPGSDKQH